MKHHIATAVVTLTIGIAALHAEEKQPQRSQDEVITETMKPYAGPVADFKPQETLIGTVMCGYQGWFNCPGDGADKGWYHWERLGKFEPGSCTLDLWPDVSEYDASDLCETSFLLPDGKPARVYSGLKPGITDVHFRWMKEYGIDGVFVQRFAGETFEPNHLYHCNRVLANCRDSANKHQRAYAVMYDLSGLRKGSMPRVMEDWKNLRDRMKIGSDPNDRAYLKHNGKPVVAVWGIGFNDNRDYTLDECMELIRFLKDDPKYGGFTVMIGVPTWWRTLKHDCVSDPKVHEIAEKADIISPWMVGRFNKPEEVGKIAKKIWKPDIQWCKEHKKEYLPVLWPGFSWHNMFPKSPFNQVPRLGGRFLWEQYYQAKQAGATMIYQAMFDEVDEGTAIYKCTNNPPVGESQFLTFDEGNNEQPDHYLWLVGEAGKMIGGETPLSRNMPERESSQSGRNK